MGKQRNSWTSGEFQPRIQSSRGGAEGLREPCCDVARLTRRQGSDVLGRRSMSSAGLEVFDKTLQTTHIWLNDICEVVGADKQLAWHLLGAVLHALRDRVPLEITQTSPPAA
jgi:hypothetical protein